jgi:hypothetical protein
MKKITVITLFCIAFMSNVQAQLWTEFGVKGSIGTTLLYNQNIFNDDANNSSLKSDYAFGPRFSFNFGDKHSILTEGLFSKSSANYRTGLSQLNYKWQNIDAYLLYRYYYERSFIEIGPKLSMLRKMEETDRDVKANFNDQNLGAAFGFGGFLAGGENFALSLNFRFDYHFSDFVNATGKSKNYINTNGIYTNYEKTNPIIGRVGLDLAFGLGGVAKAKCGQRVFFFGGGR